MVKMIFYFVVFAISVILVVPFLYDESNAQQVFRERNFLKTESQPSIADPNLKVEMVVEGIEIPTTMAFLGDDDFIVLEKEKGKVLRVNNGTISRLLDVNVANSVERGMLVVAVSKNDSKTFVFLYFTIDLKSLLNEKQLLMSQ